MKAAAFLSLLRGFEFGKFFRNSVCYVYNLVYTLLTRKKAHKITFAEIYTLLMSLAKQPLTGSTVTTILDNSS